MAAWAHLNDNKSVCFPPKSVPCLSFNTHTAEFKEKNCPCMLFLGYEKGWQQVSTASASHRHSLAGCLLWGSLKYRGLEYIPNVKRAIVISRLHIISKTTILANVRELQQAPKAKSAFPFNKLKGFCCFVVFWFVVVVKRLKFWMVRGLKYPRTECLGTTTVTSYFFFHLFTFF